ncbi:MAG TPA: YraN family protein [Saprospiraceae bacterium]|nr:YraN family protein [Saprospiraceae bacterium]HMP24947.1 YraN family protein [Saprospiraceae bacterium]
MAKHLEIGKVGEALAQQLLMGKGYKILAANWRWSRAEVDLIAQDHNTLVFVEVKTRSRSDFGQPEEFITPRKERFLADAASVYMEQTGHEGPIRFDVVAVLYRSPQDYTIEHYEDAFFPGLE